MGVESDKLRTLVDTVYPTTVTQLTNSIASIDTQLTELNAQKDAVEWGMAQAQTDQETILSGKGADTLFYTANFGTVNLSEFFGYDLISTTNITYVSVDSFDVDGDQTSTFTNGLEVLVDCGVDGDKQRTVSSSVYNGAGPDTTTITLDTGDAITSNIADVYELAYEYLGTGWDSDTDIVDNIDYFADSYTHLNDPMSTSGTYGINDRISKFQTAKTVQENDKNKYSALIILYDRFAT